MPNNAGQGVLAPAGFPVWAVLVQQVTAAGQWAEIDLNVGTSLP
jgi:hypothetical protein